MGNSSSTYVAKRASVLSNPLTNPSIFLSADNASYASFVAIPGQQASGTSALDGKDIYVRATGKITTGTSATLTLALYYATAARTAITYNGTGVSSLVAPSATAAFATASGNWSLETVLCWDITSQLLSGYYTLYSSATPAITAPTVTSQLTAVDFSQPGVGFVLGAKTSATNASNTVSLSEFILEVL